MNVSSRRDLHLDLANLLQKKEQAAAAEVNSVKDEIKNVANYLLDSSNGDHDLDAAFAYYVAGYYVRALRLISESDIGESVHPAHHWLALVLSKRFKAIEEQACVVMADAKYIDSQLKHEIENCGLSDYEVVDRILTRKIAEAMLAFVAFAHYGDEVKLDEVRSILRMCGRLSCKARESQWWWWIECIRLVVGEYAENCLWTQLKLMRQEDDLIVSKYVKANYERSSPVVELWRTQVESLPWINDSARRSFCLAIPTSGGKTCVAELAILRFLIDHQDDPAAKCVYIAPFRKLANEVEETLSPPLRAVTSNLGAVSSFYGGQEIDPLDQNDFLSARVLIVTPEKLDGMLRNDQNLRSQIKLVIVDEGHMIGEGDTKGRDCRGYRYRMLLDRLVYALKIKDASTEQRRARLLFVSGVLPNVDEFAELITGDRSNTVKINWRPLDAPKIGRWEWDGTKLRSSEKSLPPPSLSSLHGCASSSNFEEILVRTAFTCARNDHTMVFSASKKAIDSPTLLELLNCLSDKDPIVENQQPLPDKLVKRGKFEKYYSILERGVAIHHADLPADLKKETEKRINDGQVRLLFTSPTLAQGVNLKFSTAIIYRLQYYIGNPISDSTFWNVVGRVGRPIDANTQSFHKLEPPRVVFLINGSPDAPKKDKFDARFSNVLIDRRARYRVATPFLKFLNEIRKQWNQNSGQDVAELVNSLAERSDLKWMPDSKKGERNPAITRTEASAMLRLLDEHLIALMEEADVGEKVDEWLQERSAEVIDLLTGATSIEPEDLEFIKEAVLARARYIARISPRQRKQDYLLGLPLEDCDRIRANEDSLLSWYQGCTDIFARKLDSGLEMLAQLLNFVSTLSICTKKVGRKRPKPLPPLLVCQAELDRKTMFKKWILGEDTQAVEGVLKKLDPNADFDDYREEMLEKNLPWGVSAIGRFLNLVAEEKGLPLTRHKDLPFLPSLVKYGVPSSVACHLVKRRFSRDAATRIAELYVQKMSSENDWSEMDNLTHAEIAVRSLTEDDIANLRLNDADVERIRAIKSRSVENVE